MNPDAVTALRKVIKAIRHEWPTDLIDGALAVALAKRPYAVVAGDALDAATNLHLKAPGVLATHRRTTTPTPEQPGTHVYAPPIAALRADDTAITDADRAAGERAITAMYASRKPRNFATGIHQPEGMNPA